MTTGEIPYELLQRLPKTDLHCHLDGSLRLDTVLELAKQQGVKLPTFDRGELHGMLAAGDQVASLDDYLRAFDITLSVMQVEDALERCAYELAEDAWRENVRYLEVRYSPLLHTRQGMRPAQVVEAVLRGLRMAKREFGIRYGVILCAIRSLGPESSLRIAELCIAFKNRGVVGFDLAGSEVNNPAKVHKHAFQLVVDNNINCTAHAGESFGPDSVHQAIHKCGAHRIGHGTRLVESGDLLNYVNDHRIPLEVCPSSNLQTRAATSWDTHPVDFFVDYGLRVTINTDNRLMSDTTVTKELQLCHQHYGWSLQTIKEIIIAGFKSAFMPYREKADLVAEISRELAAVPDPRGEVTGRVGLVESEPPISATPASPAAPSPGPKPQAGIAVVSRAAAWALDQASGSASIAASGAASGTASGTASTGASGGASTGASRIASGIASTITSGVASFARASSEVSGGPASGVPHTRVAGAPTRWQ